MRRRGLGVLVVLLTLSGIGCSSECAGAKCVGPGVRVHIEAGSDVRSFTVEVAATPETRATGLMNRRSVPDGTGMLFLFPRTERLRFWMKNTLVPLDIAFIRDNKVLEVRTMTPCRADPCPLTTSAEPADAALEAAAEPPRRCR